MGQKVSPTGLRLGIVRDHTSVWYAGKKDYAKYLKSDLDVRAYIARQLAQASVSRIDIERPAQTARITIHTARPGIVIGKKGEDVDRLRQDLARRMDVPVHNQRRGDPQAGTGRPAGGAEHRAATRAARPPSTGHAPCHAERDAPWGPRYQGARGRTPQRRGKSRARKPTPKAAFRCTRCAPTSTTPPRRPRPPTASLA